jgi:hypothetical protein
MDLYILSWVFLHSSPILGLYVVVLRVTQLALVSSARLLCRFDLMYFLDGNNCSHKYVEPKMDTIANANL